MPLQVKASFWFLICAFMQKGITSITTPIFTRLLTTEEYGQYSVFLSWQTILTNVITLNLFSGVFVQGLVKFDDHKLRFASAMQGLELTLCASWTVIYLLFHNFWNNLLSLTTPQMLSMILIIWTSAVFQFWAVEQRVELRYKHLVILTTIASIGKPLFGIILVLLSEDKVLAMILGIVIADVCAYAWLFFVQMRRGKVFYSGSIWKYALMFNLPLLPHYLSMSVLTGSDRIMIKNMVGSSEAGIYNLAHGVAFIMTLFNTALLQTIEPWLYKKIKEKKIGDISAVAYPTFVLIAAVNLFLIILAPEVVAIFAPPAYYEAIWVIPPLAMSVYFMFAYCFFAVFEFYYEKTRLVMIATTTSAVLNIMLNYIFIQIFGYKAAGYTTLTCYIIYASFHYLFMRKICNEYLDGAQPYKLEYLLGITGVFLLCGFMFLLTYNHPVIRYSVLLALLVIIAVKRNTMIGFIKKMLSLKKQSKE